MSKKTIETTQEYLDAWEGSEARWARIAANPHEEEESDCALCSMQEGCDGCPINKVTRGAGCTGTPFDDFDKNPSHATAGAMLDWLKANRPRLKVKPKALTLGDLRPGDVFEFGQGGQPDAYLARKVALCGALGDEGRAYLREADNCVCLSDPQSPVRRMEPKK